MHSLKNKASQRGRCKNLNKWDNYKLWHLDNCQNLPNLLIGVLTEEINNPTEVTELHEPSGKQTHHADGIGTVSLTNNILSHNPDGHLVVVFEDSQEEDDVATKLNHVKSNGYEAQEKNRRSWPCGWRVKSLVSVNIDRLSRGSIAEWSRTQYLDKIIGNTTLYK